MTETNIRYPTDSSLLLDGVRLLSRWLDCAGLCCPRDCGSRVSAATVCTARRRARQIGKWGHSRPTMQRHRQVRREAITQLYAELIQITSTTLDQANQAARQLNRQTCSRVSQALILKLNELRPLIQCVMDQTERRVLKGEAVPAQEKIASLWEPHTQIIRRGKSAPHETEFGHKVNFAEVEHGLISDWQVIVHGNPPDARMLPPLLRQHGQRFGHAPRLLAGDRGLFSAENESLAAAWASSRSPFRKPDSPRPSALPMKSRAGSRRGSAFAMGSKAASAW